MSSTSPSVSATANNGSLSLTVSALRPCGPGRSGHARCSAGYPPPDARSLEQRVAGEAEDALADLVAGDLRGAAGDRHGSVRERQHGADHPGTFRERAILAGERGGDPGALVPRLRDDELRHVSLGARFGTGDRALGAPKIQELLRMLSRFEPADADRRARHPRIAVLFEQVVQVHESAEADVR